MTYNEAHGGNVKNLYLDGDKFANARLRAPDAKSSELIRARARSDMLYLGTFGAEEDHRTPGTRSHPRSAILRPVTMNATHDKCAGSSFDAEICALAASTINSFDWLAVQCRDAGYSGGR